MTMLLLILFLINQFHYT